MSATRRNVIKAAAAGGLVLAAGAASPLRAAPPSGSLLHQVYFWLKNPASAADRDALIEGLRGLAAIPLVRSLTIGVPAGTGQREVVDSSFDVSALMVFDGVAEEKAYQDHPIHLDFVAARQHLWGKVAVYDSLTVAPAA